MSPLVVFLNVVLIATIAVVAGTGAPPPQVVADLIQPGASGVASGQINFDELPDPLTILDDQYLDAAGPGLGVDFNGQYGASVYENPHSEPHVGAPLPAAAGRVDAVGGELTRIALWVLDDHAGSPVITLRAFDAGDALLASVSASGAVMEWEQLEITLSDTAGVGIAYFTVTGPNGKVAIDDLTIEFGGDLGCLTDLNGDGRTDGADLAILLGGWGECE